MIPQTKWLDRTFDFNISVGVFPCLIERLRGTPVRTEELISTIQSDYVTKRLDDKWSIQENVGHLLDLETLHEGRIYDYLNKLPVLRAADMHNKKTEEMNHNSSSIQKLLRDFRNARLSFVHRLEELDEESISLSALHPRLQKPMRVIDLCYFIAEHDDYHLTRIQELKRKYGETTQKKYIE